MENPNLQNELLKAAHDFHEIKDDLVPEDNKYETNEPPLPEEGDYDVNITE